MRPSSVRRRIMQEHDELRRRLDELERDAEALERLGAEALEAALQRARSFYDHLRKHTELEDRILVPAVREVDAWGDVRAERLLSHHREQREQLRELSSRAVRQTDPQALAKSLRTLVAEVREDMGDEEKGPLSANLLRDDVVGINVEDG